MIRESEHYYSSIKDLDTVLNVNRDMFKVNYITSDLNKTSDAIYVPMMFVTKDIYKALKANKLDLKLTSLTNVKNEDFISMLSKHDLDILNGLNSLLGKYVSNSVHINFPHFLKNEIDINMFKINLTNDTEVQITDNNIYEYIDIIHINGTIVCIINPFLNPDVDVLSQVEKFTKSLIKIIVNELFKQYDEKIVYSMWDITH